IFYSSRRRHTRFSRDWSSDVCSSDLAQCDIATGILGNADDAAGHGALELVAGGEIGRVRAAIAHGHAEALARAEHHVGTELAGRSEERRVGEKRKYCVVEHR